MSVNRASYDETFYFVGIVPSYRTRGGRHLSRSPQRGKRARRGRTCSLIKTSRRPELFTRKPNNIYIFVTCPPRYFVDRKLLIYILFSCAHHVKYTCICETRLCAPKCHLRFPYLCVSYTGGYDCTYTDNNIMQMSSSVLAAHRAPDVTFPQTHTHTHTFLYVLYTD